MRGLLDRALGDTESLWPDVRRAFDWVHKIAHTLRNEAKQCVEKLQEEFNRQIAAWAAEREQAGSLASAVDRFLKVTESYRPGLFHCYRIPDLPRTNNDLEHFFGSQRHHERRTTGRKKASRSLVIRGAVRVLAATLTRLTPLTLDDLASVDRTHWLAIRHKLRPGQQARILRARFRRNPDVFLTNLERLALKPPLPP